MDGCQRALSAIAAGCIFHGLLGCSVCPNRPRMRCAQNCCRFNGSGSRSMSGLVCTSCQPPQAWCSTPVLRRNAARAATKSAALHRQPRAALPERADSKRRCSAPLGCLPNARSWFGTSGGGQQSNRMLRRAGTEDFQSPRPVSAQVEQDALQDWPQIALWLFVIGCFLGPFLDAIHSRVGLQEYDTGALSILGLKTNVWVPPLLGVFYSVVGLLQLVLDKQFATRGQTLPADPKRVVGCLLTLAALLELSAELYKAGVPYNIEAYILFIAAEANWVLFDSTWWGFALACAVGIGCPLAEVPVQKLFGLWHYSRPNYELFGEGMVTWVLACYFFYTPFLSNLSRWLSSYLRQKRSAKKSS